MLSYQHGYHAGNLADFHKHALLAWTIHRMAQKPKPFSYVETHSGRGLYDLSSSASEKTGEAAAGIIRAESEGWLEPDHPLNEAIAFARSRAGENAYPGSPMIAQALMPRGNPMHLAELHPQEFEALEERFGRRAELYHQDGFKMANAVCPPTPRRGLLLIDPSYELKEDYDELPDWIDRIHRKWNVGTIILWYPILSAPRHLGMTATIRASNPETLISEVAFPALRDGHGMTGSGMLFINPQWGTKEEAARISRIFAKLGK